jgi:uncharacterized protein YbaA (DUF1428 family)
MPDKGQYIEGFVFAVPTDTKDAFRDYATMVDSVFIENGALEVLECWGVEVPEGEVTSMPMAVRCKPDETVVFAWVRWPSREAHALAAPKIMADPRLTDPMPFDGKRLIYGGFEPLVELHSR